MMFSDPNVPEHDEDVYGDVPCPGCGSFDITVHARAFFKGMIGVHRAKSEEFDYVISNTVDSFRSDEGSQKFVCDDCLTEWPVDGKIYWEWYE